MVSLPGYDLARAMENWGLIVQSESTLLQESDANDPMEKAIFAITIVHEIAHQWFDIWFNEGLATLFENIVLNEIAPELGVDVITVLFFQQALFHDTLNISIPLNYPVELLPTIEHKFDGFAYAKASVIFRMVKSFVGDEAFKNGLHRYFNQFRQQYRLLGDSHPRVPPSMHSFSSQTCWPDYEDVDRTVRLSFDSS
ncbi:hypothetical protein OUZ56_009395 [Daphnia magna]|uniref:Peptidase M1 membrane alanine aminopeptidase domain-containing protein n=1 Tax=Daphnia magna TaxID=35525 RepID=A0ABR0AFW1_9CRUS|nr:hypothetical protein OUZ56_009395 [Daphnia magna]